MQEWPAGAMLAFDPAPASLGHSSGSDRAMAGPNGNRDVFRATAASRSAPMSARVLGVFDVVSERRVDDLLDALDRALAEPHSDRLRSSSLDGSCAPTAAEEASIRVRAGAVLSVRPRSILREALSPLFLVVAVLCVAPLWIG